MKRVYISAVTAVLCFILSVAAFCETNNSDVRLQPRLVDNGEILSDTEESIILSKLNEISERQSFDVIIVTVSTLDGKSADEYAADFYTDNNYGFGEDRDGILLLIGRDNLAQSIYVSKNGSTAFTDAGVNAIKSDLSSYLSDGKYYKAFVKFTEDCDQFIKMAKNGTPYVAGTKTVKNNFTVTPVILAVFAICILIAVAIVYRNNRKLKLRNNVN